MYEKKSNIDYDNCPIRITLDTIAGSWKLWLIQEINRGVRRPTELQKSIGIASKRVLNKQLRELEEARIVYRQYFDEVPPHVEYFLTPIGKELLPIMEMMRQWGDKYLNRA